MEPRLRRRRVGSLLTLALLAVACSKQNASPIEVASRAWCERMHECSTTHGFPFESVDACVTFKRACETRLKGSRGQGQRCARAIRESSCDALLLDDLPEDCVFEWDTPSAHEGEQCRADLPCAVGSYCDRAEGSCGVCVAPGDTGDTCSRDGQCESLHCRKGACVAPGRPGAPCSSPDHCEGYCEDGTCVAAKRQGEPCTDPVQCSTGAMCRDGTCVKAVPYHLGDPCTDDCNTCVSGGGCRGSQVLACVDGTCALAPGEGEACDFLCRPGFVCVEGACAAYQACGGGEDGATCMFGEDCAEGLLCLGWHCVTPASAGAPCPYPWPGLGGCAPGAYCEFGGPASKCQRQREVGEACANHWECMTGFCDDQGRCAMTTCG